MLGKRIVRSNWSSFPDERAAVFSLCGGKSLRIRLDLFPSSAKRADFLIAFWQAWTAPSPGRLLELFANATSQHSQPLPVVAAVGSLSERGDGTVPAGTTYCCGTFTNTDRNYDCAKIGNTLWANLRSHSTMWESHWMRSDLFRLARAGQNGALS